MRLLLRGLWWRRGLTLAVLAVAVVTTTAAALGPLYARAAAESILQDHLTQAGTQTGLHFHAAQYGVGIGDVAAAKSAAPAPGTIRGYPRRIVGVITPQDVQAVATTDRNEPVMTPLVWRSGECRHLVIVSGHCPTGPAGALAAQRTVATHRYGWHLGTKLDLGGPAPVRIVGLYRPRSVNDAFWFGSGPSLYFAPRPADGPDTVDAVFTTQAGFQRQNPTDVEIDVDYPLQPSAIRLANASTESNQVRDMIRNHRLKPLMLSSNLPKVISQAASERHLVDVGTLLVTLQLAMLAWLVLFQVVSDALESRGNEIAMAKLRGHRPARTVRFGLAEPLAILVLAIPIGIAAALGITHLFASSALVAGVPVLLTWSALWTALIAFAGGVVAAALAGYRILTRSVLEQWRRTERRPGHGRLAVAVDVVLAGAAVAAVLALDSTRRASETDSAHDTLALLAPALLVFAVAIIGVRLLPPVCRRIADRARGTRRIGTFLATRQVSRRPVGLRLAALLAVAVGLATFGVAGETVASANRSARADAEVGARRVLSVQFNPTLDPIRATHRADPQGRWAMAAAAWLPDGGDSFNGTVLGVDASRLAAVGLPVAGGLSPGRLASVIGGSALSPLSVHGDAVRVHVTAARLRGDRRPNVQVDLRAANDPYLTVDGAAVRDGAHQYVIPVHCRSICLLRSFTWDRPISANDTLSGTITVTGLDVRRNGTWHPLSLTLADPHSWYRLAPQGQADDHVQVTRSGVRDDFSNRNGGYGGIAYSADPSPMPVVATPRAIIVGSIVPHPRRVVDGLQTSATMAIRRTVPVLPQVLGYGLVTGVQYLTDELPDFVYEASWQVWVGPHAPPDYRQRLEKAGFQIQGDRTTSARVKQLGRQAPALALLLLLACALAGAVLAVGGTAISVSSSSRRRSYELASLRVIGVQRRSLVRAGTLEQLLLLGTATLLGVPTGLLAARFTMPIIPQFADPTPITLTDTPHLGPTLLFAGAFVVLLVITALVAARALVRIAVPSRLRESE